MDKNLVDAINLQIQRELASAYLYFGMKTYFEANAYEGFANWMYVQGLEEMTHAVKFHKFLVMKNEDVELMAINAVPTLYSNPAEVFNDVYEHEQEVTKNINDLYDLAKEYKDNELEVMMHWFVEEQTEELASTYDIVQKMSRIKDDEAAIMELDDELGDRKFVDKTAGA